MGERKHTPGPVEAAQCAIDAHQHAYRLEDGQPPSVDLWHLIASLLEWCDASGVDFDATLSEVREHFVAIQRAEGSDHG